MRRSLAARCGLRRAQGARPAHAAESTRRRLNVGLATADRTMMVYLESIRYNPRPTLRSIVAGQQVPMELTSLGRAYLAGIATHCSHNSGDALPPPRR